MKTFPIPRRLPCPPVHHQLFRPLRHFRVQVVQEHPQRRLLLPPLARNLRAPRRPKRPLRQACFFHCSWHSHAHEFPSPPLILAHATPFCTSSHSYLGTKNSQFSQMCCVDTNQLRRGVWDDLTKVGEEDAPWYCSRHSVFYCFPVQWPETGRRDLEGRPFGHSEEHQGLPSTGDLSLTLDTRGRRYACTPGAAGVVLRLVPRQNCVRTPLSA